MKKAKTLPNIVTKQNKFSHSQIGMKNTRHSIHDQLPSSSISASHKKQKIYSGLMGGGSSLKIGNRVTSTSGPPENEFAVIKDYNRIEGQRAMEKPTQQKFKNTNFSNMMVGPGKGLLKRSDLQKSSSTSSSHDALHPKIHKGPTNFRLQDEVLPTDETMKSLSQNDDDEEHEEDYEEGREGDYEEEEHEVDSVREENIGSTSHGVSVTRKESRALNEAKKRRSNKETLVFEVDECAGRIIGEDSQHFITKGGCVVRDHAKFDGTTWRNQTDLLKYDIITKCMENSTYDPSCRPMVRAIHTQLANQHKSRQYRLHLHFKKFPTIEEAINNPPNGVTNTDWVKLCQRFASEEFQNVSNRNKKNRSLNQVPPAVGTVSIARIVDMKRREGEEVSVIDHYKIGHFSKKKNKMVNDKADEIWNELQNEEAASSYSPAEICMKKLRRIPGYAKGRSISTKQVLATEKLQMELELEKEKSKALEEQIRLLKEEQLQFQEEQNKYKEEQIKFQEEQKEKMEFMMNELSRLARLQFQKL